jgi:phosphatidylinositol glycan class W
MKAWMSPSLIYSSYHHYKQNDHNQTATNQSLAYKFQKEAFVTGCTGTSAYELILLCMTPPLGLLCYQYYYKSYHNENNDKKQAKPLVWELFCFIVPMILVQSNYLYPWGVLYLLVQFYLGLSAALTHRIQQQLFTDVPPPPSTNNKDNTDTNDETTKKTMTIYRSGILLLTIVAILAVDFNVFPRRFVKTETSGYSLMDLGAASFVVAAGFVSPRAKGRTAAAAVSGTLLRRMLPLVVLGMIRLATHQQLDYPEHVSEYGRHWNFFLSLAMLHPVAAVLPGPGWILPVLIMLTYQALLTVGGLQKWIEEAPRSCIDTSRFCHDLVAANREGLFGCVGFAALFLMSEWIGYYYFWNTNKNKSKLRLMILLFVVWQGMELLLGITASRRTTNATFIVWVLWINLLQFTTIDEVWKLFSYRGDLPILMNAMNRHGLVAFLAGNLMTGLVNLSINTLQVSDASALSVLFLYSSAVGAIVMAFDSLRTRLASREKSGTPSAAVNKNNSKLATRDKSQTSSATVNTAKRASRDKSQTSSATVKTTNSKRASREKSQTSSAAATTTPMTSQGNQKRRQQKLI